MLSHDRGKGMMRLTKNIYSTSDCFIIWAQYISGEGKIYGIGSLQQKRQQRGGNWCKTLQNRINTRHEKGKDWKGC